MSAPTAGRWQGTRDQNAEDQDPLGAERVVWGRAPVDPTPWVRVHGGAGGTVAHLESLQAAAVQLAAAAGRVDDAAAAIVRARATVEATAHLSPGTAAWAGAYLSDPGCSVAGARLRALAHALDQAAAGYRDAESAAAALLRGWATGLARAGGYLVGQAGPAVWVAGGAVAVVGLGQLGLWTGTLRGARALPTPVGALLRAVDDPLARRDGPLGLLGRALGGRPARPLQPFPRAAVVEPLVAGASGFVLGAAPGTVLLRKDGTAQSARILGAPGAAASLLTGRRPRELLVARTPAPAGGLWTEPPRTTSGLLQRVGATYPTPAGLALSSPSAPLGRGPHQGVPPGAGQVTSGGTVVVQQLHREDGSSAWVVTVPGTQEWSPLEGPNPMDLSSNLAIMGEQQDDATATLLRAMRGAGIGPDEPVVLAGHSQGGLTAMRAAADPWVREELTVAAVVTAGSPVGAQALPADVHALHLETSYDYVPTLDSRPNPDTPARTTVQVDLDRAPRLDGWAPGAGAMGAHKVSTYAAAAAALEHVEHPSLAAFDHHLRTTLGDVTAVSTQAWTGVRVPAS